MSAPPISFVMTCYNQENIVHEAVEAALLQDYEDLQIVISDDCSTDATYDVVRELVAAYEGPHRIILNRNPRNLGIAGNVDSACALADGEYIVIAAGDDRSLPQRTRRVADAWVRSRKTAHLIHSPCINLDAKGRPADVVYPPFEMRRTPAPEAVIERYLYAIGASLSFSKACLDRFGPISEFAEVEDHVLVLRAALLGQVVYLDEPLVHKRPGGIANLQAPQNSYDRAFGMYLRELPWKIGDYRQFARDLETVERPDAAELTRLAQRRGELHEFDKFLATTPAWRRPARIGEAVRKARSTGDSRFLKRALIYAGAPASLWLQDFRMARRARHDGSDGGKAAADISGAPDAAPR